MGKREIGELSILDLVVFIMIAEMAVIGIEDTKDPLIHTIIPMVLLMIIQIVLAYISLKSQKFREFVDGKPTLIIENGKIDDADFELWKKEYTKEVNTTKTACLSPNKAVDLLGFQTWKDIFIYKVKQEF